jgi:hypothetical protein
MTALDPDPFSLSRLLSTVFLVGLILAAGTSDIVLPAAAWVPCGASEPAERIESPVDVYCRIRQDGLSELRPALVAGAPRRAESSATARGSLAIDPPRFSPAMGTEHQSSLSRRSRAPSLRAV